MNQNKQPQDDMSDNEIKPEIMNFDNESGKVKKDKKNKEKKDKKEKKDNKAKAGETVEDDEAAKKARKEERRKQKEAIKAAEKAQQEEDDEAKRARKEKRRRKREAEKAVENQNQEELKIQSNDNKQQEEKQKEEVDPLAYDDGQDIEIIDFSKQNPMVRNVSKKPKKTKLYQAAEEFYKPEKEPVVRNKVDLNNVEGHQAYSYSDLLELVYDQHVHNQPQKEVKINIKPNCTKAAKKSTWYNFDDTATKLKRDPQHILQYFKSELGCDGNIGYNGEMILTGSYMAKHFKDQITKYLEAYVICKQCNSQDTELSKKDRLWSVKCNLCQCNTFVQGIESHYRACGKGERKKAAQKAI